jgi:hypothetical protein
MSAVLLLKESGFDLLPGFLRFEYDCIVLFFFMYFRKVIMTLRQRYKSLNNPNSVKEMIVTSVFNTMQMEGQPVSKATVENLYSQVKKEQSVKAKTLLQPS